MQVLGLVSGAHVGGSARDFVADDLGELAQKVAELDRMLTFGDGEQRLRAVAVIRVGKLESLGGRHDRVEGIRDRSPGRIRQNFTRIPILSQVKPKTNVQSLVAAL